MNNKEYQAWAMTKDVDTYAEVSARLLKQDNLMRLLHAAVGMCGESGELIDAVKKSVVYGKELDVANVKEELGDALWYMALALKAIGSSFDEVMELNKTKLEKRYPTGFTEKDAILRADKKT